MNRLKWPSRVCALASLLALVLSARPAAAQGVTTASMAGIVKDAQGVVIPGASIVAVHKPSGTTYETVSRPDGRFSILGMRVGGPYTVSASLTGFSTEEKNDIVLTLGVRQDIEFSLRVAQVAETITVTGRSDVVFSSARTGAATAVSREELATLPTISGRINDVARLSPEFSGAGFGGSFAGQDNRMNNITVDGSYFNNSFGLAGQPGDRTGVAPISLEAIEQLQVSVAPYDVRQGNFVGAGLNTVTRSGANRFTGSVYHRMRNESYVGKEAVGQKFNPGTFDTTNTGEWAGGPIVKDWLFFFESFENQQDKRPLTTYTSNPGGAPATGNTTRVLASDLTALSAFLSTNFQYQTGPFDNITKNTPGKPFLVKGDYNINPSNKVTFRYNQLKSSTDVSVSSSSSLGFGRQTFSNNFLGFQNSNYTILEDIKSGIGEWNSVIGSSMSNNLIVGYTKQDESRGQVDAFFPFVDVLEGGNTYTSFGTEPFTPANLLYYNTFQAQDSFTRFGRNHTFTFGGAVEKYHSDNSFYFGIQSAYVYDSLDDFYADANDYLANPGRTTSPVTLDKFQVRSLEHPRIDQPAVPAAGRLVLQRLRPGRMEAAGQCHRDRRSAGGRRQVRRHRLRQLGGGCPDVPQSRRQSGALQHRSAAQGVAAVVAASGPQLGRQLKPDAPGARRHGRFHRQAGLRLDLQPDRQHGHPDRIHPGHQHHRLPVQSGLERLQARCHGPAACQRRRRGDRSELQVSPDLAHECRGGPQTAVGPGRHCRVHLQPRRQRDGLHQRQPARGAVVCTRVRTAGRSGPPTGSTTRLATRWSRTSCY